MISCSSEDIEPVENPDFIQHTKLPVTENSRQFGTYDALGYGYNATGEYGNVNAVGLQVIDTDKFNAEYRHIDEELVSSAEYNEQYGKDAVAYSKVLSGKVTATQSLRMFGKTIYSAFGTALLNDLNFNPEYIYGSRNVTIKFSRYRFFATSSELSNYVTPDFLNDIQNKTPEQIVAEYGTHVTTDIYLGAQMDILFQAKTTNPDRERAASIGIKTGFEPNSIDARDAAKNYDKKVYYRTRGGDASEAMAGMYSFSGKAPTIEIAKWQSTCTKKNSVLIDFGDHGLVIIYDLVKDPQRKALLKAYVDDYLSKNQVTLKS
ncbi:MAC/perforin domain-containing protein [Chryseobacterium sp. SORGH_AS_1175]|nr:MAC/perforin domain-containing protein [Chryseobacterium sp. SORGH_AS_1175]